ncbi:unnamed protein product [Enterobius vermicularis]|uniref:F-box domain-containing protein n=1 Tax=Enterobius vermicularis TaxID=51028 RepID=A0A0N4V6R0_ENTVE|nr:unnamed protein product [Enterobius vermicularis]
MSGVATTHRLDKLPREIILMIMSNLSSKDLWTNVRVTCRVFHDLLVNSYLWLNRVQELGLEPGLDRDGTDDFYVIRCCIYLEGQRERWTDENLNILSITRLKQFTSVPAHHATVDAIKFFSSPSGRRLCISGSRDRSLILWDVENIASQTDESDWHIATCEAAHQETHTASCTGTVLRVLCDGEEVFYSTYDRKVGLMDVRSGLACVTEVEFHKSPVLDLAHTPNSPYIYSCGEDCRVLCIDRRAWKAVKTLNLPAFSKTLSLSDSNLLCGTANGKIIMLNTNDFSSVGEVCISPLCQIVQVQLTPVSQICITRKRDFRMYTTGSRPCLFAECNDFETELARFDLHNEDLAITCGDGSILFWLQRS